MWDVHSQSGPGYKQTQSRTYQDPQVAQYGGLLGHGTNAQINDLKTSQGHNSNKKEPQAEPEAEINFFEDMTPKVKRQPKVL